MKQGRTHDWLVVATAACIALIQATHVQLCRGDDPRPVARQSTEFETVGVVSSDFRRRVDQAWQAIPPAIGRRVLDSGWRVKLAPLVVDAVPELVQVQPRGWPAGTTWNNTDAVHLRERRIMVFAERRHTRDGRELTNGRVAGVLGHEVGHAFDLACHPDRRISSSPRFRQAYQRDVKVMQPQVAAKLAYYLQGGGVGRQEAFAEAFAVVVGQGSDVELQPEFRGAFPTSIETVRVLIADYQK